METHSQKEKLKLCRFSTHIEIFMFCTKIEVENLPHIPCSSFLPRFEVLSAHTIIGGTGRHFISIRGVVSG